MNRQPSSPQQQQHHASMAVRLAISSLTCIRRCFTGVDESDGGRVHTLPARLLSGCVLTRRPRVSVYLCLGELHHAGCYLSLALILMFSPPALFFSSRLRLPFGGTPPPRRPGLSG